MMKLQFPDHFPPKDRWGKFFLGVRWLGPDLSFFNDLKVEQGKRSVEFLAQWGNASRQQLAQAISKVLSHELGWKSEVFLPEDAVAVAFHGPRFDFCDSDSAFERVVETLDKEFGIHVTDSFWHDKAALTLGQLVDELLLHRLA
jgi:hypothetical protein